MTQTLHERYLEWARNGESYSDWLLRHIDNRRMWIGVAQSDIEKARKRIKQHKAELAEHEAELARIASQPIDAPARNTGTSAVG